MKKTILLVLALSLLAGIASAESLIPPEKLDNHIVFSYDEQSVWAGSITMYRLNQNGQLVDDVAFRAAIVAEDDSFGFRPAPLQDTGAISTNVKVFKVSDRLIMTQYINGHDSIGAGSPMTRASYALYEQDDQSGFTEVISGTCFGYYEDDYYGKYLTLESQFCNVNDNHVDNLSEFQKAFEAYGVSFGEDYLRVGYGHDSDKYLLFPDAVSDQMEILLDIKSAVESELPPDYETLVTQYGLAE